jgi:predicted ATP-binding protein involved in virulence
MAMVGDLARRLAILNPMLPDPLHGPGVVLIDELDLHLHPKLQHAILLGLQEVFPNCQFLLSTHSPHVMTHVPPKCLFLLEATEEGLLARRADTSYGKAAERVLEDLMGMESTRPDKVAYALRAIFDQIGQGHLNAAREAVTALRRDIGNDPDLLRADLLIQRRELLQ